MDKLDLPAALCRVRIGHTDGSSWRSFLPGLLFGRDQPYIRSHASPEQAGQMFTEMNADFLIPIHHQTFILSYEPPDEPLERLLAAADGQADRIVIREAGETFVLPG